MDPILRRDFDKLDTILDQAAARAKEFLAGLDDRPAGATPTATECLTLPDEGLGTEAVFERFFTRYAADLSGSPGPRYFGLVTGGATPAALAADWLVSAFDQNVALYESAAATIEVEAIDLLRQLFGLSDDFSGTFVTGATMANLVGLSLGRQWIARQRGVDAAAGGTYGLSPIKILSGAPHSTIYKALAMLGMGRQNVQCIPCLPAREAVDVKRLERELLALDGVPCIVVANAGTVNTVDYDDLSQIAALKENYPFWLHVDGAFGGFAVCSPHYRHLVDGLLYADSITIDAHKWLNVPYDSAMQFTRHRDLQLAVFQMSAAYLGEASEGLDFAHLTPESSRRFRALPSWFTLLAYGRQGYQEIVERNCELARQLGRQLEASGQFRLLAPTRMNVVCFTLEQPEPSTAQIGEFLNRVRVDGRAYLTPTTYDGTPAIRAAISNWRTQPVDIALTCRALQEAAADAVGGPVGGPVVG